VLLEMDPNTQWRFTRAYDSGEVDGDELPRRCGSTMVSTVTLRMSSTN
jgi:hypothetical protein